MARIAIIDLLFNWPPDGGARVDLKEIASRLMTHHEVRLFVPDFPELFPRGRIEGTLPFPVTRIPFTAYSFNCIEAPLRFKKAVNTFRPDHVFIADGWHLKPYLVLALKKYRPVLRFYAYECLCLQFQGTLFRNDRICDRTIFDGIRECLRCTFYYKTYYKHLTLFSQELFGALAFLPTYPLIVKQALKNTGCVLCYNEQIRKLLLPFQKNVRITPSGIDTEHFSPGPKPVNGIPTIFMPGRIYDRTKGFHVLREAVALLKKRGLQFNVIVPVKEGTPRTENGITYVRWHSQATLPFLYRRADIGVVPSVGPEPFGIVALEAMACGLPVVGTNVGGLKSIVQDNSTGFLINPNDPEALAQKLTLLLRDKELRHTMGKSARKRALEYSWNNLIKTIYLPLFA
jgi:glycosyltransferase involved in cell wall biosynthesis